MRTYVYFLWLLLAALYVSPAAAFDFANPGKEIVLTADKSAMEKWRFYPAERGDTVWDYCARILTEKRVTDIISPYQCSETAMSANGFTSWNDFKSIQIGQLVLLPSSENDSAVIRVRAAGLKESPMGLASEIRRLAIADDAITARLVALETTQLSPVDVQTLISSAVENLSADGISQDTLDGAIATVNRRITNLDGVTAIEVSAMIADAVEAANVPSESVMQAIDGGMKSLSDRLTAVEKGLKDKADTIDVDAKLQEVNDRIEALTGVDPGKVAALVDGRMNVREANIIWWVWVVCSLAVLALVIYVILSWNKLSTSDVGAAAKAAQAKADALAEEVAAVKVVAQTATEVAAAASKQIVVLMDRLRDVEEVLVLHLTLDAQGRFSCSELSDKRLKELGDTDHLMLEIICLDNRARKVRVSKGVGGDGNPRLHFFGLEKGKDFIDSISLIALYRHLAKARLEDWIIGITAAAKAA